MFFEDRKFIDIGHTVQQQYHGGALKISEFAHVVNASVLAGEGIIEALEQTIHAPDFPYKDERAVIILAEMTTAGSLAKGHYTHACMNIARKHKKSVIGFVATQSLTNFGLLADYGLDLSPRADTKNTWQSRIDHIQEKATSGASGKRTPDEFEDFVIFTTGINSTETGDDLGQRYQTPTAAVTRGSDFVIAGRGIYDAPDPVEAVKRYRENAWEAYLIRTNQMKFNE
jgi:orotidine-5'-phosphate decarboxylase